VAFSLLAVQTKALGIEYPQPLLPAAISNGQQYGTGTGKAYYLEEERGNEGKKNKCL